MSLTKIPTEKLQSQVREQGAALADKVGPAMDSARDWATPRVGAAVEWAQPRLEGAAPRLEAAVTKVGPAFDMARDRLVDDLLPRLVKTVNEAAAATRDSTRSGAPALAAAATTAATAAAGTTAAVSSAQKTVGAVKETATKTVTKAATKAAKKAARKKVKSTGRKVKTARTATRAGSKIAKKSLSLAGKQGKKVATRRTQDAIAALKGGAKPKPKGRGKKFLLVSLIVAGGAVAFSAVRNRQKEDPWAAPGAAWTPAAPTNTPIATAPPLPDPSINEPDGAVRPETMNGDKKA